MDNSHQSAHQRDAELLQLAVDGEEWAFLLLYQKLKRSIFRYAFYMTNSNAAAEEVTQEVFISLLKDGHNFRPSLGDVSAFAFGIARNLVRRMERRERPYLPIADIRTLETLSSGLIAEVLPGQVIQRETAERVRAAVSALPDHYRQVVVLCDLCELSYMEAASRLRCAVGTIRSRLNRAHALLAKKLKPLETPRRNVGTSQAEGCVT
jgi:RNA polymerase sigma-70 factor, ECF subfamily